MRVVLTEQINDSVNICPLCMYHRSLWRPRGCCCCWWSHLLSALTARQRVTRWFTCCWQRYRKTWKEYRTSSSKYSKGFSNHKKRLRLNNHRLRPNSHRQRRRLKNCWQLLNNYRVRMTLAVVSRRKCLPAM